ncbi:MAG TPA: hypothetical protein PKC35_04105 [Leptospiraceae bacterium]|nr:hypothetical protein [Leptospiraceae bacterium]
MFTIENKQYRVWWRYDTKIEEIKTVILKRHGRKHTLIKELTISTIVCSIQNMNEQDLIWLGTSECSPDDMNYRPKGRGLSLDRAIESLLSSFNRTSQYISYDEKTLKKLRRDIISQVSEKVNIILE